jgi:hypothetical protein
MHHTQLHRHVRPHHGDRVVDGSVHTYRSPTMLPPPAGSETSHLPSVVPCQHVGPPSSKDVSTPSIPPGVPRSEAPLLHAIKRWSRPSADRRRHLRRETCPDMHRGSSSASYRHGSLRLVRCLARSPVLHGNSTGRPRHRDLAAHVSHRTSRAAQWITIRSRRQPHLTATPQTSSINSMIRRARHYLDIWRCCAERRVRSSWW